MILINNIWEKSRKKKITEQNSTPVKLVIARIAVELTNPLVKESSILYNIRKIKDSKDEVELGKKFQEY